MSGTTRDILIRADGFYERGLGHIYRCATLGRALAATPGLRVSCLAVDDPFAVGLLRAVSPCVETLPPWYPHGRDTMLAQTAGACRRLKPDLLFLDILDTPVWFMEEVRKHCGSVICMDDLGPGAALADAITGVDIGVCADIFEESAGGDIRAEIHGGPAYCIVREDVLAARDAMGAKEPGGGTVAVVFGGSDPQHATIRVLYSLLDTGIDADIKAVFGPCNEDFDTARQLKKEFDGRLETLSDPDELPRLMAGADIAVCGVGNTLYEFLTLGVPCVVVSQAELQEQFAVRFDDYGCAAHIGRVDMFDPGTLAGELELLLGSREEWSRRSRRAMELFDGRGVERIAALLKRFAGITE